MIGHLVPEKTLGPHHYPHWLVGNTGSFEPMTRGNSAQGRRYVLTAGAGTPLTVINGLPEERQQNSPIGWARRSEFVASAVQDLSATYGVIRFRSRGKREASRTFSSPKRRAVSRSRPMAKPPWGGIPNLKTSR